MKWLVDFVILHRKRYLEEIEAEKEFDELFKNQSTKMTLEEIKNLNRGEEE